MGNLMKHQEFKNVISAMASVKIVMGELTRTVSNAVFHTS